jgi:16S rRNA C967 or C1407 C5-methylase (RsmB/RsmF family)
MAGRKTKAGRGRRRQPAVERPPELGNLSGLLPADEVSALAAAMTMRPPKAVRPRPAAACGLSQTQAEAEGLSSQLPFASEPVPWFPEGRFCVDTHQPGHFLAHAAGTYFVQDAGSMLALRLLDPRPTEWVADVCAAPGGKASAILERVGPGGGFLLANEPIHGRVPSLEYNLARVGFPRYAVSMADPEQLATCWAEQFQAVLVDAPCTGQTLLGRGRQSAAAFVESRVAHAAARQRRILQAAATLVAPGGRLVYSTCTFAAEENELVIAAFLAEQAGWTVELVEGLEAWQSPLEPGGYRLYPHRDRCGGAYAIRLRRKGQAAQPEKGVAGRAWAPLVIGSDEVGQTCGGLIVERGLRQEEWPADVARLVDPSLGASGEVAYRPGKHWMPAHALALRRDANWRPHAVADLDDQAAQQFLQGMTLPAGLLGWAVATWRGHPLGWLRGNRDRRNNGLPAAARLRFTAVLE